MIYLDVNLANGDTISLGDGIIKGGIQEVAEAAKLLYPTWSSLVLTLTKGEQMNLTRKANAD